MALATQERAKIAEICAQYEDSDIYNADETALYWRQGLSVGMHTRKQKGRKIIKERVSLLLCTNASGTEKRKLLCIGKASSPRSFGHRRTWNINNKIPVISEAQKKAWMDTRIWTEWLHTWVEELRRQGRRILLLYDNMSAHKDPALSNIELHALPPNTTSVLQPLDQGIIAASKGKYKTRIVGYNSTDYWDGDTLQLGLLREAAVLTPRKCRALQEATEQCKRLLNIVSTRNSLSNETRYSELPHISGRHNRAHYCEVFLYHKGLQNDWS
jgi:hypothetical protein